MTSAVYFKFKASLKQYTIPFEGSAISVKDLRNSIRLSCGLKSTDFELQIVDKQGKEYPKEDDLIPKFSDLIVRRLPKQNDQSRKKIANPEDMTRRDPYKTINALPKINPYSNSINLAKANIPDDEKLDIMTKRCSDEYAEKNYTVKSKPYGVPPATYVCNKCHQGGHWIHECPGLRDKEGKHIDFKAIKRPTGIPQDFLLEVASGTPGAYLTKEGKYMVPIKDAEAYAMGKKEKRPFSLEENPPYISKAEELPPKLQCPLCLHILDNPTNTPCCSMVFCLKCISDYLYDPEVNGSRKCPSCLSIIEHHESLTENELLRQLIPCWKASMLTKDIVDSCLNTAPNGPLSNKKTELNEDSRKSPEINPVSLSEELEPRAVVKTEDSQEVFVNNRRVLKPKTCNGVKAVLSADSTENSNIKVEKMADDDSDQDVNDLIFDKVQDFEIKGECMVKCESMMAENTECNSKIDVGKHEDITDKRADIMKNTGSRGQGSRNPSRRVEGTKNTMRRSGYRSHTYRSDNSMKSSKSMEVPSNMLPAFNNINSILNSNNRMFNQFASQNNIVNSMQRQILGNTMPLNSMEALQWPVVNTLYNNIPLQTMLGAALNGMVPNWIGNGLHIPVTHPSNSSQRILTKNEFYERQRRMRAKKLKSRSRSSSGSLSPRKVPRPKCDDHSKNEHKEGSSRHRDNSSDKVKEKRSAEKSRSSKHREILKTVDLQSLEVNRSSPLDIKAIDPMLMQESINTFFKYLTASSEVESTFEKGDREAPVDSARKSSDRQSRPCNSTEKISKSSLRSTRSRSVPKVSRERLLNEKHCDLVIKERLPTTETCVKLSGSEVAMDNVVDSMKKSKNSGDDDDERRRHKGENDEERRKDKKDKNEKDQERRKDKKDKNEKDEERRKDKKDKNEKDQERRKDKKDKNEKDQERRKDKKHKNEDDEIRRKDKKHKSEDDEEMGKHRKHKHDDDEVKRKHRRHKSEDDEERRKHKKHKKSKKSKRPKKDE